MKPWQFLMTAVLGALVGAMAATPRPPPPDLAPLLARLDALEARADAALAVRCINVTTAKMDLAIFPVDNLGVKKVAKP